MEFDRFVVIKVCLMSVDVRVCFTIFANLIDRDEVTSTLPVSTFVKLAVLQNKIVDDLHCISSIKVYS